MERNSGGMNLSASPTHSTRTVAFPDLPKVFALAAALLMWLAAASAQRPVPRKSAVSHSSRPHPQFQEVEDLVRQGSLDQDLRLPGIADGAWKSAKPRT